MNSHETCDVLVLGAGPAGLQAAIHAARRKVSVLVLGRGQKSSAYRAHIENYCCMSGIPGEDLLKEGRLQAERAGARFLDEDVIEMAKEGEGFTLRLESGRRVHTKAVVFAMGISRKKLGVRGEKEFLGRGLSYCVECDAGFYRQQAVAVIGCESAAASGALTLLFYASQVHLVCARLDVAESLAYQLSVSGIHIHEGRKVVEIAGREAVEGVILDNGEKLDVTGVFIELGAKGAVELAAALGVSLDPESFQYIVTNKNQETNVPGIYAAGDICGPPWQVAKAVGEGCVAGLEAATYVKQEAKGSR